MKDGNGEIVFTLKNTTRAPVQVLKWQTPLGGLEGQLFDVTRGGVPVPYIGPMVKCRPPGPKDYLQLAPNQTLSAKVNLLAYYGSPSLHFALATS